MDILGPGPVPVHYVLNGHPIQLEIEPDVTLVDVLRDRIDGFLGTKVGCGRGQCGACTVLINGERRYSCIALGVMHNGAAITTIEGLAQGEQLHPMQQAFIDHDAFQCGYCTPGQILSAVGLLNEHPNPTDEEIRHGMNGNICRCAAYPGILAAIQSQRHQT